jgi:hypothetical protein
MIGHVAVQELDVPRLEGVLECQLLGDLGEQVESSAVRMAPTDRRRQYSGTRARVAAR